MNTKTPHAIVIIVMVKRSKDRANLVSKHNKKTAKHSVFIGLSVGTIIVIIYFWLLLRGRDIPLLDPKGIIAGEQLDLMLLSTGIMLVIAIPTLSLLYFFAWKYREKESVQTIHMPQTKDSKSLVFVIWGAPLLIMLILASVMWPATHRLAPQKSIASDVEPLRIQVVALRWKWLFIYPQQNIATVNFIQVPINTPLEFDLSADEAPMSSFWIPNLGGQLYAMTGHANRLNLMAEEAGDYTGSSAEINGKGFSGMRFVTRVSSTSEFNDWVDQTKLSTRTLDLFEYQRLLEPSENNKEEFFTVYDNDMYAKIVTKYDGSHGESHDVHKEGAH